MRDGAWRYGLGVPEPRDQPAIDHREHGTLTRARGIRRLWSEDAHPAVSFRTTRGQTDAVGLRASLRTAASLPVRAMIG